MRAWFSDGEYGTLRQGRRRLGWHKNMRPGRRCNNLREFVRHENCGGGRRCRARRQTKSGTCTSLSPSAWGSQYSAAPRLVMSLSNHFLMLLAERSGFTQLLWQAAITRRLQTRTLFHFLCSATTSFILPITLLPLWIWHRGGKQMKVKNNKINVKWT